MEGEVPLDPIDFLRELYRRKIPYLLVGRQALILLGAPLMTQDYDFFLSPEAKHLEALIVLAEEKSLEFSVKDPREKPIFSLLGDTLKLDFFRARSYPVPKGGRVIFEDLFRRKQTIRLRSFEVYVPTIEDLIRTKMVRNSPKDREDIKYLQVLLENG